MNREWHVEIRASGNKLYAGYLSGEPDSVIDTALRDVAEKTASDEYGEREREVTWICLSASRR